MLVKSNGKFIFPIFLAPLRSQMLISYTPSAATSHAYPIELPIKQDEIMMMMGVEDDEYFGLDNAVAWANMFPPGGGFIYLGEEKRRFTTEMFHSVRSIVCLD